MKTQRILFERNNRVLKEAFNNGRLAVLPGESAGERIKPLCEEKPSNRGNGKATVVSSLFRTTTGSSGRRAPALCSQPISDHGVGTVRPWAAVNLNIARGRHNVSAARRWTPGIAQDRGRRVPVRAPPALAPNAPPTIMPVHSSNQPYHRPADAVVLVAGDLAHHPRTGNGGRSGFFTIQ